MSGEAAEGNVIVLVAPSGSGKTTIARRLLQEIPRLRFSVSATTRPPRTGEKNNVDYHFISPAAFQDHIDRGDFLEWEEFYNGQRYGSLRPEIEKQLKKGYFILFDVEVKGALAIKRTFGERCLSIFIKPPSIEELRNRLRKRGSEDDKTLAERLERAKMELQYEKQFDVSVVNNDLETAYSQAKSLVESFINNTLYNNNPI